MQLIHEPGRHLVRGLEYSVQLRDGALGAVLADPAGRAWSRLSLLASAHRTDLADESYDFEPLRVAPVRHNGEDAVELQLRAASSAWRRKAVLLRCFDDRLELTARVEGTGTLGTVQLLGGAALLPTGSCGTFRSSVEFACLFDPAPTEPIQVVRAPFAGATLGVIGDTGPGRLHGVFAPPPLCLVLGRQPGRHPTRVPGGTQWLALGVVAPIDELRFVELRYVPEDGGFLLELDYDGHTAVDGAFVTPTLVLRPASDPSQALRGYRFDHVRRGYTPPAPARAPWWSQPLFCGWGAQCARAAAVAGVRDVAGPATEFSRKDLYDQWLSELAQHDIVPGTVVIDDRWQRAYGTGEPDRGRWPGLREWIAERHAAGQRVLLWWKAWDPEGLPAAECVLTPSGVPVAADPGSPAYRARLAAIARRLVAPDGLDADGFKTDFLQRAPAGRSLRRPGAPVDAVWGIAGLHTLLATLYRAAKAVKPDALVITHSPHPGFGDVTDMLRLNDVLVHDAGGAFVPAVDQLAFRHAVVSATMPDHLIDTDQWPIATRDGWRDYVAAQCELGVPSLYYAEHLHFTEYLHYAERVDRLGDALTAADFTFLADTWRNYRATHR